MLIILEGLDLAGKSYIAEQLLKQLPECYYLKHGNRPKGKSLKEQFNIKYTYCGMIQAWNAMNNGTNNMIFDRFFPSELVYSFPKRGYDAFKDPYYSIMENQLLTENSRVLVIYVYTHKQELLDRLAVRGDDHMLPEDIDILSARYHAFIANTHLAVYQVQSGTPINEIMEKLNEYK